MNYAELIEKRDFLNENIHLLPDLVLQNYEENFVIGYTHNSTAIEGNTLTLRETALVLADKISIGGKEMREIYEVVDHKKAYEFVKENIENDEELGENIIKDIHMILTENIGHLY